MKALGMQFAVGGADLNPGRRLATGDWLATQVFTSLFTDAQAPVDLVSAGESRGGYWGDTFSTRSLGSLLWMLRREKLTPQTLLRARDICLNALVWLLDAGYITAVDVETTIVGPDRLGLTVICTRATGATERFFFTQEFSDVL